jgi:hypothetical protein
MLSFTIDGKNYECPTGFGEITISEYATYMATVVPLYMPISDQKRKSKKQGFFARLTERLNKANEDLKASQQEVASTTDMQLPFETAFISHWLKCPMELAERIEPSDLYGLFMFINEQWQAWEPIVRIQNFMHDGRLWEIDYSIDRLAEIPDMKDLQTVVSCICTNAGKRMKPWQWGDLSIHIAASIMAEVKRRHSIIAPVIGDEILKAFNINQN